MSNVLSWYEALEAGHKPKEYSYRAGDIPEGVYQAILNFEVWAKIVNGISCYFTSVDTGNKILLTVYRDYEDGEYFLNDINFRDCATEAIYSIEVNYNSKGNPNLISAKVLIN